MKNKLTYYSIILLVFLFTACETSSIYDTTYKLSELVVDSTENNNVIIYGKVTDIDGNIYNTITIGNQEWMAENLRTTHYADGSNIPYVGDNYSWAQLYDYITYSDAGWCVYGITADESTAKSSYNFNQHGALYTWAAAAGAKPNQAVSGGDNNPSGIQGACPNGWHLPSDTEFKELEFYLAANGYNYDETIYSGYNIDVAKTKIAKAMGETEDWQSDNTTGAIGNTSYPEFRNKSGFSGRPSGFRSASNGNFGDMGLYSWYWTTYTLGTSHAARSHILKYNSAEVYTTNSNLMSTGYSVRCVKN